MKLNKEVYKMSLKNLINGNLVEKKEIKIFITETDNFVDFLVQDQGEKPDENFEKQIWHAVKSVIGERYGVSEWQTKQIKGGE
jgi:sensor histidine kinase regulating citrate/malate metabolism